MRKSIILWFSTHNLTQFLTHVNIYLAVLEKRTGNDVLGFLLNTLWVSLVF